MSDVSELCIDKGKSHRTLYVLGSLVSTAGQGGHGTGNLVINFSRHGKRREFKEFNKKTGKTQGIWTRQGKLIILGLSYGLTGGGGHLGNKICSFLHMKTQEKIVNTGKRLSHEVDCGHPAGFSHRLENGRTFSSQEITCWKKTDNFSQNAILHNLYRLSTENL